MNKKESNPFRQYSRVFPLLVFSVFLFFITLHSSENNEYNIKAWMIEDGLPQNSILTIHLSRSGYLWLGTKLGLIRFNGLTFPVSNIWNTPGLKSNRITAIYEDSTGSLWIGTRGGGLSVLKDDHWTNYQINEGLNSNHVNAITEFPPGTVWCGTTTGLNYIKGGKVFDISAGGPFDKASIQALAVDPGGNLWIGSESGLFKKNRDIQPDDLDPEPILDIAVSDLLCGKNNELWIGTRNGVRLFKEGQLISPFPGLEILDNLPVTSLFRDRMSNLWIGTYGEGLYRVKQDQVLHYNSSNGLSDDFIHTIKQDNDHNIWIGTFTGGLVRLKPRIISNITREKGLPGTPVTAVLQDRNGHIWMGTRHKGVCQFKNNRFSKLISRKDGLLSNRILSICESINGEIWIGTEGGGLSRYRSTDITSFTRKQGLLSDTVSAILQARSGILWIGTDNGLNAFINGTIIAKEMFRGYDVKTLFEDQQGALWVGSQKGLSRIKHDNIRHFQPRESQSSYEVLSIFESPAQPGVLWIGTNGTGLLRYEKDRFTQYTNKNGLYSDFIFSITETGSALHHYLWMSSFTGIFRVSLRSLNQFLNHETNFITSTFFNESDGMINSECVSNVFPSAWKSGDETIFFPTIKGLAILNGKKIPEGQSSTPIIIEDFIIDNKSYILENDLRIESGKNMFEFYFTALNYSSPRNIIFRYRLEGFEDKWTTLGQNQKRTALYLNLGPGSYRFRVTACNHLGEWNEQGISFPFRIRSDFKESLLVYIPRIIILLVFIGGFLLWRRRKPKPAQKTRKYQTSALTPERSMEIQQKLSDIMEHEQIYLDADLTLKKLAEKINAHPNHISQIVNEKFKQSFNDYINKFRISAAKQKLLDPRESEKTILEIAYDVGFYSKSVFNTAFKKFTGITPSQFKQRQKH
jgi:ligand-binding sensor domain-containing protein/AraC-like DNA-binding protein